MSDAIPQTLSGQKFFKQNFSGRDLKKKDMRRSTFYNCNFDDCDMTEADCSGSEFHGSTFRQTNCHGANFKDAKLHGSIFEPSDCYGMTLTMQCQTFQGMQVSRFWWDAFMYILCGLMVPEKDSSGFDPRDKFIAAMGRDEYMRATAKFRERTM